MPSLTERRDPSESSEAAAAIVARLAATPRAAGSEAEADARAWCTERLQQAGYRTAELPFDYSALPGRWGTPLVGLGLLGGIAGVGHFSFHGQPAVAVGILASVLAAVATGGRWLARRGVLALPAMRQGSVNLVATRGSDAPRVWLMAHLDTKSQPVPIAIRALAIAATALLLLVAVILVAAQLSGMTWGGVWILWTLAASLTTLPIIATTVGNRSNGALDNASGVATVLLAAEQVPPTHAVGVCLTSGEELGLAGARAWVATGGSGTAPVLNVDGVDDVGSIRAMWSGTRPDALLALLARAGVRVGEPVAARRLLPGILTDSVAVTDAGGAAVTLSRGTVRTLLRIHRPADEAGRLSGDGIARLVHVLTAALKHF